MTRSGGGKEYAIIAQQSGRAINGVANDTTVLYSLYEKNVLSIWKANISTLKKTQVAKITVKAKEAELCAYYNNTVYYRATSKKGAKLLFSYPLSTKVSKKIGSGVYPCAQVSGFLVYTRDKLDGSEGAYLKCYNMKTKKSVSMDNAAESVRRWGKYIYYSRYGENIYKVANMTARVPSLEVIRYDLDTNQKTTLLNIDRHGASVARITGEGVYHRTPDDAYGKYTDFATEDTRDAEPYEISGV